MNLSRPELIVDSFSYDDTLPQNTGWFPVFDPATGDVISEVCDYTAASAEKAVDLATIAFDHWRKSSPEFRSNILMRTAAAIRENAEDLSKIITLEMGKPLAEAFDEVEYAASYFQWFAHEAVRGRGEVAIGSSTRLTASAPVGVCAAITPWNFPSAMIARKVAPALAAGCSILVKPAEATPLSALALNNILLQSGCPTDVVQILTASNPRAVVDPWLSDRRVRKLTFTGSTETGRALMAASARTVKRLSLELGGNAPFLVFADADLDMAVDGLMTAKFRNAGQTCVCANRILVSDKVVDAFAERLVEASSKLKIGNGLVDGTSIGPLINAGSVTRVVDLLQDASSKGATLLSGGIKQDGAFLAPIILKDVPTNAACMEQEIFGPLASIVSFGSDDEAISMANASDYGLAAYAYTNDLNRTHRLMAEVEAGMIGINTGKVSAASIPFGGVKQSGFGREGGPTGIIEYLDQKAITFG